jgi:3-phosphoshikimate 1-carboxyvinyltransferase
MSFALAGLVTPGVVINDPSCVNKTFPDYFEILENLSS